MKKLFLTALIIIAFASSLYGEEKKCTYAGFSSGYTWFHNYSGFSGSGMNFNFFYEPSVTKYLNLDTAILLNIYWTNAGEDSLFETGEKNYYFAPQFLIGPRGNFLFFDKFSLFFGAGLSFTVGIDYLTQLNEVDATFSPGFYAKAGFDFAVVRFFAIGLELKYNWSVVHIPHTLSVNLRLSYRHRRQIRN